VPDLDVGYEGTWTAWILPQKLTTYIGLFTVMHP